jgi:hypothetical protein
MALVKLLDSSSFFQAGEQTVTILDLDNTKGLVKQASDSRIQEFASQIVPDEKKIFVHMLAMGAGEYYGANRNGDWFPENNLIDCHKTFETSPAHIFRNHVNKNPEIAIGQVVFSVYNQRMHRVEVIAWIDKEKGADVVERIARGDFPATSMACRTAYDVCSICGNKAHTRQEYCEHMSTQIGKMYPDGRKVMAINSAPLKFFDMSIVVRPADVTSSVLQKVASAYEEVVGSADAAEAEGILEAGVTKQAAIQKLSEFIKEVEGGHAIDYASSAEQLLNKVVDPDHKVLDILTNFKLNEVLDTMGHLGISPSVAFLAELIGRKTLGAEGHGIGSMAAAVVNHVGAANLELPVDEGVSAKESMAVIVALMPYMGSSSVHPEHVEKRAYIERTNVGFVGNGPKIEPTPYELLKSKNLADPAEKAGLLKKIQILLTIGASALAAKWYITRVIEQKIKDADNLREYGAKIHLVKSASDLKIAYKLAKADMVRAIAPKRV